jgi:pyruvate kinase
MVKLKGRKKIVRDPHLSKATKQLLALVRDMKLAEKKLSPLLSGLHDHFKVSGTNLVHYLVLRSNEIRDLQEYLHQQGLSSLTNLESHTLYQVQNVLRWLQGNGNTRVHKFACDFETASRLQEMHTAQLLGEYPSTDRPHIMVTFSTEMTNDRKLIEEMLHEGMSVARINCAHDDPGVWTRMIQVLRQAVAKSGKSCKIYMDIAGPKIRIKSIHAIKPKHNEALPVSEGKELILTGGVKSIEKLNRDTKKERDIITIQPKELITMMKAGERIFFDDGKFEAQVIKEKEDYVIVRIVRISAKNHELKPGRGINLPDSELTIPTLTEEDKVNLPFICQHADMIGYSFVSNTEDIDLLRTEINKHSHKPAIVLKIERLSAVQHLPALLLSGMQDSALGVMIARGDLAVEIGFERLSEIQEEILWICEAAHVPVIWATQVLETLNKTGFATRSEITDAAMSVQSECVMLNKGKYIVKTIQTLDDILTRQTGHLNKKRYVMRPLGIAKTFIGQLQG